MNEHKASVEWCWQYGKTKALGENQAQSNFFHHKCHTDLPGIEIRSLWWQMGDSPPKPWNCHFAKKTEALFIHFKRQ